MRWTVFCIASFLTAWLADCNDDDITDFPDYMKSPYFSDHLHYALGRCSENFSSGFDPSFVLFLKNELVLNPEREEICIIGCSLKKLNMYKDRSLNLHQMSFWLRNNLRTDFPYREDFIGYYVSLAAWCHPKASSYKEECDIGKYYYECVTKAMKLLKPPYDSWMDDFEPDVYSVL